MTSGELLDAGGKWRRSRDRNERIDEAGILKNRHVALLGRTGSCNELSFAHIGNELKSRRAVSDAERGRDGSGQL